MHKTLQRSSRRLHRMTDDSSHARGIFADFVLPNHSLLEYGSRDGSILRTYDCRVKAGIEPNVDCAAAAVAKGLDVRTSIGDFDGTEFDSIVVNWNLDTVDDFVTTLRHLAQLLTESGKLLVHHPIAADVRWSDIAKNRTPIQVLRRDVAEAGYTVECASVKRSTSHVTRFQFETAPFQREATLDDRNASAQLQTGASLSHDSDCVPPPHLRRLPTYRTVVPSLAIVVVARRT